MHLDSLTLVGLNLVFSLVNIFGIGTVWVQNRRRFEGIHLWLCSIALQLAGLGLLFFSDGMPPFFPFVASNVVMAWGGILLLVGLKRFFGLGAPGGRHLVLLAAYAGLLAVFTFLFPNPAARFATQAVVMTVINGQIAWLLLARVDRRMRPAASIAGSIMAAFILVDLARLGLLLSGPPLAGSAPPAGAVDEAATVTYTVLGVCLTISLTLMVNRRLLVEVRGQEEKFSKAFHSAPYGIVLLRAADGKIFEVNDSFARLAGYAPSEMLGRTAASLHLFQQEEVSGPMRETASGGCSIQGLEVRLQAKSGEIMTGMFHAEMVRIRDEDCLLVSLGDITELCNIRSRLEAMATHDAATGLPNRTLFRDRFRQAAARAGRDGGRLAVLSLDLDNFKRVNDACGHQGGDAVLVETARRLRGVLRESDTVARFGGDEFVLLLGDIASRADAGEVAEKIRRALGRPFTVEGRSLRLEASIGIALFPEHGCDMQTLLRRSDEALYQVKADGRDGYRLFAETASEAASLSR
jgi:diguanylate cyclase (GGDEF)-like protein/PAS domain S-box-containing protein